MTDTLPGIRLGIPELTYHSDTRTLSASGAKTLLSDPALTAALKVMLTETCWRCSDGDGATCDPCLSELVAKAERDAEVRTVMASLRGMFDPMTGRPVGGGW